MIRCLTVVLALVVGPCAWGDEPPEAAPPVFAGGTLVDALARAKSGGSVVVADFTAEWCDPCKMMERTVWRDARVEKWFKDHGAAAIRVDTDKEPEIRKEYAVFAWPTFIGYKGGEIVDRRAGSMTTDQFLAWLEQVDRAGKPAPGGETIVLPAPGGDPAAPPKIDTRLISFKDRLGAAHALVKGGRHEKATQACLWLWRNIPRDEAEGHMLDRDAIAEDMRELAAAHAPAREAFLAERDRTEGALRTSKRTFEDLDDWLVLNSIVNDERRSLAWFDRVKSDPDIGPTFEREAHRVLPMLEAHERWADYIRLIPDPIARLRKDHGMCARLANPKGAPDLRSESGRIYRDLFRSGAATLYLGLLASDRDAEAAGLAAEAAKLDDAPETRIKLVERAVAAKLARKAQLGLLDQAEKAGADVKELRKKVLAAPK